MWRLILIAFFVVALAGMIPAVHAGTSGPLPDAPGGSFGDDFGTGSYLGVDTRDVSSERMAELKLKEERGVEVTMVDQDAPAGKAGLKERDVILSFNGQPIEGVEQLRRMIRETPPGRIVNVGISREGQPLNIKVQLQRRKTFVANSGAPFNFSDMHSIPPIPPIQEFDVPSFVWVTTSKSGGGL